MATQQAKELAEILTGGIPPVEVQVGRFSLNDFHRAAGGEAKHQPSNWLRLESTQALIAEISNSSELRNIDPVVYRQRVGTFACKELVYAYAMWISAAFQLKVIRAFDALATGNLERAQEIAKGQPSSLDSLRKSKSLNNYLDGADRIFYLFPGLNRPKHLSLRLIPFRDPPDRCTRSGG